MHDWTVTVVSYICILSKDLITKVTMHCDECLSSRHFEEWVNSLIIRSYLINFYKIIYIEIMHRSHIHSLMLSMSRLHQGGSCIDNTLLLLLLLYSLLRRVIIYVWFYWKFWDYTTCAVAEASEDRAASTLCVLWSLIILKL